MNVDNYEKEEKQDYERMRARPAVRQGREEDTMIIYIEWFFLASRGIRLYNKCLAVCGRSETQCEFGVRVSIQCENRLKEENKNNKAAIEFLFAFHLFAFFGWK